MYQPTSKIIKNQKGFTFLEALFQLIVVLLFSHIIALIYMWFHEMDSSQYLQETTWEMFIFELQQYIDNSEEIFLTNKNSVLHLKDVDMGETTQISRYGDMIRKQVDNTGHVPLFIGIKQLSFKLSDNNLIISVEFLDGVKKERSLFVQNNQ